MHAGQHLHPDALMQSLRAIGLELTASKNAALQDLTRQLPLAVLVTQLGYSAQIINKHGVDEGTQRAAYAAHRVNTAKSNTRIGPDKGQG